MQPLVTLRAPKLFNLRSDPFERYEQEDGDYVRWFVEHAFVLVPAQAIVGEYLVNLTPNMLYSIAPLAVLITVLVTFGVLNRNSEIIAMKATGISLYRLVIPIVSIAAILALSLFLFDEFYLPQANRRQEALRSTIKGRPQISKRSPQSGIPRQGDAN